jgi:hypothetical protein
VPRQIGQLGGQAIIPTIHEAVFNIDFAAFGIENVTEATAHSLTNTSSRTDGNALPLSPGHHTRWTPNASMAVTPSTTHGGHPGSRGAPVATTMASSLALEPVNLTFEFGDLLLSLGQGHCVFPKQSGPLRAAPLQAIIGRLALTRWPRHDPCGGAFDLLSKPRSAAERLHR